MNAVELHHLTRTFGDFSAVEDLSFTIPQGEIFGLLGPNGAGKTTAIRMMCGILLPSSGSVEVLGFDVERKPEEVKSRIGYMSQKFSLYNDLTPVENIDFYASVYGVLPQERRQRIEELLHMADLVGHERQLTRNLSGAWRQRLALACAIVHRPQMLFLDEATAGVDPSSRREFWELIYRLAGEGVSVLATTHYMDEADYCNTIGMMYQGVLIALDSPEVLKVSQPGVLVEVNCDHPATAVDIAFTHPGVLSASVHGAQVHITLKTKAAIHSVKQTITQAGIQITGWEIITPSLEDVFINMVAQHQTTVIQPIESQPRSAA